MPRPSTFANRVSTAYKWGHTNCVSPFDSIIFTLLEYAVAAGPAGRDDHQRLVEYEIRDTSGSVPHYEANEWRK